MTPNANSPTRGEPGQSDGNRARLPWGRAVERSIRLVTDDASSAGSRDPHRVAQPLGRGVPEQKSARAKPQRLIEVLVEIDGREHEHRGGELGLGQEALCGAQAVELGHPDIHQHDVPAHAPHDVDPGAPIGRTAHHPRP